MDTNRFPRIILLILAALALAALACTIPLGAEPPAPEGPAVSARIGAAEGGSIEGPGGSVVTIAPAALSQDAEVTVQELGAGEAIAPWSALSPASLEYQIELGEAEQVGEVIVSLPLAGGTGGAAQPEDKVFYVAWVEPEIGAPNLIGSRKGANDASPVGNVPTVEFPLVGSGKYQVFKLIDPSILAQALGLYEPLAVPTYRQNTPAWCSPTALTDLAQFHQEAWPVGGQGSVWGESANFWLAGQAGQPATTGYFFHWLLGAGGYSVPADVKQSFSNMNAEVIIWNWNAAVYTIYLDDPEQTEFKTYNPSYVNDLFDAFKAYAESQFWGANGTRRPVAWGSSIAGHSRVLTGSNGTTFYYNDPGSGSLNSTKTWEAYRQDILSNILGKTEVIDTVVFSAPPRPENARRGVIWLNPMSNSDQGSFTLLTGPREHGYFYDDPTGALPDDPEFDNAFIVQTPDDVLQYRYSIRNIAAESYDFDLKVELYDNNGGLVPMALEGASVPVGAGQRYDVIPPGLLPLDELSPGRYTFKLILTQGGVVQDVKYVHFRLASTLPVFEPPEVFEIAPPWVIFIQNANCRRAPGTWNDAVTSLLEGQMAFIDGVVPDQSWLRIRVPDTEASCWVSYVTVEIHGVLDDVTVYDLPLEPSPTATAIPITPTSTPTATPTRPVVR
jgi:hypothetical protein